MKKKLGTTVAAMAVAFLLASNAEAQSQMLKFEVPFAFSAGGMVLESGSYNARIIANGVLQIRSDDGKATVSFHTQSTGARGFPEQGKLMFNRYGEEYFLSKIFWPGFGDGREVLKSKNELLSSLRTTRQSLAINPTPDAPRQKTVRF